MVDNEFTFEVINASNDEFIAQLTVNKKGEPVKWSTRIGEYDLEHVLGPLKKFNNALFPVWGSTTSGIWRYEHKTISLSKEQPSISYDPPSMK